MKLVLRECVSHSSGLTVQKSRGAITTICAKTWYVAWLLDKDLLQATRLHKITHKTDVNKEEGVLTVNKR